MTEKNLNCEELVDSLLKINILKGNLFLFDKERKEEM